jgi:Tol biopolymer transport system component
MEKKMVSIIELLDTQTGKTNEILRTNGRIEAPFFRGCEELYYNGGGLIYRYSLKDKTTVQVPTGFCIRCNNDHVLSPCGKYLAVSHDSEEDYASRIYILPLDGSAPPRKVTPLPFSYLHGWSPDGSTLSYCASRDGEFDVYVIPAEGGEEKRLTFTPGLDDGPEYSPDGKRIYFCSVRAGHMDCYFMDTNGENVCRLTDNGRNNWFPHISPDGKTVAYISYGDEIAPGDHPADKWVELRLMTADGENDRLAVRLFGGQGTINVNSWMPDSRHLAFVRYEIS